MRRQRIKAVANLPIRRARPGLPADSKGKDATQDKDDLPEASATTRQEQAGPAPASSLPAGTTVPGSDPLASSDTSKEPSRVNSCSSQSSSHETTVLPETDGVSKISVVSSLTESVSLFKENQRTRISTSKPSSSRSASPSNVHAVLPEAKDIDIISIPSTSVSRSGSPDSVDVPKPSTLSNSHSGSPDFLKQTSFSNADEVSVSSVPSTSVSCSGSNDSVDFLQHSAMHKVEENVSLTDLSPAVSRSSSPASVESFSNAALSKVVNSSQVNNPSADDRTLGGVRFGRKRFKPSVSLNVAGRRGRVVSEQNRNGAATSEKGDTSQRQQDYKNLDEKGSGDSTSGVLLPARSIDCDISVKTSSLAVDIVDSSHRTSFPPDTANPINSSLSISNQVTVNSDVNSFPPESSSDSSAERIVVPGITRLIPTGTAVRAEVGEQDADQVIQEAAVPTEEANSRPDHHQTHTSSRSEAEDNLSTADTMTPPYHQKLKLPLKKTMNHHENIRTPDSDATTVKLGFEESVEDLDSDAMSISSRSSIAPTFKTHTQNHVKRRRLEVTLRLEEAKRQFHANFGHGTPEKSKLSMLDYIFYNPTTNPMKKKPTEQVQAPVQSSAEPRESAVEERLIEESVDEPEAAPEEEEPSAMPVPQVKVGADGQIILDEASLVIETTGAKKGREDLANSVPVLDQGGGSYYAFSTKRRTKQGDWSTAETLRFYKALQVVGTDFLLMQTVFPSRSRVDLKMKFKKEERLNMPLIHKALTNPLPFEVLGELQKEKDIPENVEKASEEEQNKKPEDKEKVKKKKRIKRYGAIAGTLCRSMDKTDVGDMSKKRKTVHKRDTEEHTPEKSQQKKKKKKKDFPPHPKEKHKKTRPSEDIYDDLHEGLDGFGGSFDVSDSDCEISDSEMQITKVPQITRSGRVTKPPNLEDYNTNWSRSNECVKRETSPHPFMEMAASLRNLEPGSIIVLTTESPDNPGHQIMNVFMVGPNSQPIDVMSSQVREGGEQSSVSNDDGPLN